jgi:leucyl-tRNA synthetase
MRITAYADRLAEDLELLDWTEKVKAMQRNWIGKSRGAYIEFGLDVDSHREKSSASVADGFVPGASVSKLAATDVYLNTLGSESEENGVHGAKSTKLKVFTTRPDTIRGATFMVIAPEHPLVELVRELGSGVSTLVDEYIVAAKNKSAVERQQDAGKKTGVFLGAYGVNPLTGAKLPIYVADYVLMGYGTGAIMAVPADDERDREFAEEYGLDIIEDYEKFPSIDEAITALEQAGAGEATTTFRLRDWLFSRQRYWGEPFPIVYDEQGIAHLLPDDLLPVTLPEVPDYKPRTYDPDDENSEPEPPLGRNADWVSLELDLGDGKGKRKFTRETNTMPNWAGSCWYYLRYLDANHAAQGPGASVVDPELERYWLGPEHNDTVGASGGVDLYVGGVEHAVLHLLYARFWHKVLFDLGYVSSIEPFHKLFNQGYIQAYAFTDERGQYVPAAEVVEVQPTGGGQDGNEPVFEYNGRPVTREYGKMGKSLKNVITPEEMVAEFGADTFRIYEMSMGPLDLSRPWETRAVIGAQRYLQRLWRLVVNEATGESVVSEELPSEETLKEMHKAVAAVRTEMENIRPNTAIAKLIGFANHLTGVLTHDGTVPRVAAETIVLMTAPLAPHIAEELWSRLGHEKSLFHERFPVSDPKYVQEDVVKIGVQVNGKVRATLEISPNASKEEIEKSARELPQIAKLLDGQTVKKAIIVPGKIANFVI